MPNRRTSCIYSVDDARVLLDCQTAFLTLFNEVQRDCLGLDEDWEADSVPMTLGSLVASTFQQWLYRQGHKDVVNYVIRRLGILDQDDRRFKRNQWAFWQTLRKYRTPESVIQAIDQDEGDIKVFLHAKFDSTAMDACSVKTWADRSITTTLPFNALVHGGRCNNELPFDYQLDGGADIDISGCYGESLRNLIYPLGIPSAWAFSSNEQRTTFGDWLEQHQSDLVPGLWTATISGILDFDQDLLHSKLVSARDIRRVSKHDDDKSDILCDFPLLRREVKNAIITGVLPKSGHAALRLECCIVDGCVTSSSCSSSVFNSARHSGGVQRQSVLRSLAIASRVCSTISSHRPDTTAARSWNTASALSSVQ